MKKNVLRKDVQSRKDQLFCKVGNLYQKHQTSVVRRCLNYFWLSTETKLIDQNELNRAQFAQLVEEIKMHALEYPSAKQRKIFISELTEMIKKERVITKRLTLRQRLAVMIGGAVLADVFLSSKKHVLLTGLEQAKKELFETTSHS